LADWANADAADSVKKKPYATANVKRNRAGLMLC
jgi:hypothetical protein